MARNGSGTYTRVNTFVSGATVTASGHNENWADLETEMTNSLPRDGQAAMTGQLKSANGTLAAPGVTFGSDLDTGFYRSASNELTGVVGGAIGFTMSSTILTTPLQLIGKGTATNDAAAAGYIGQYTSSNVASGAGVALTSTVATDITNISLTAGDWDVWGTVGNVPSAGSLLTSFIGYISATSGVLPTSPNSGAYTEHAYAFAANAQLVLPVGQIRISVASTTLVYLGMRTVQTIAGQLGYGFIAARRVR